MAIFKKPGGPLSPDDELNILRKELDEILRNVKQDDLYIRLLSPRHTGKTTLLYKIQDELHGKGYAVVYLNMGLLTGLDESSFYKSLCKEIKSRLDDLMDSSTIIKIDNIVDKTDFFEYLKSISINITQQARRIVLILDDFGKISNNLGSAFSGAIRWIYNTGHSPEGEEIYKKLMFVFAGDLSMQQFFNKNSPLDNVCHQAFSLDDFSLKQTRELVYKLTDLAVEKKETLTKTIYHWTKGHPYLTQILCYLIENSCEYRNGRLEEPEVFVKSLVENKIIYADLPNSNLNHIFRHLDDEERYMRYLHQILEGQKKKGNETLRKLSIIGIIKRDKGFYDIRNEIYRKALRNYFEEYSGE